jgi:hypothetical protein
MQGKVIRTDLNVLQGKYKGENRLLNKICVLWSKHGRLQLSASQHKEKV